MLTKEMWLLFFILMLNMLSTFFDNPLSLSFFFLWGGGVLYSQRIWLILFHKFSIWSYKGINSYFIQS